MQGPDCSHIQPPKIQQLVCQYPQLQECLSQPVHFDHLHPVWVMYLYPNSGWGLLTTFSLRPGAVLASSIP